MTVKELRAKADRELQVFLRDARVRLHDLSLQAATKQLKNVSEIGLMKRAIARCLTIMRERHRS